MNAPRQPFRRSKPRHPMQCRQCAGILDSSELRCGACGLERPSEGWIPLAEAVIAPNRPQVNLPPAPTEPLGEEDPDTDEEALVPMPTLDEFDDEGPTAVGRPGTLRVRVAPEGGTGAGTGNTAESHPVTYPYSLPPSLPASL